METAIGHLPAVHQPASGQQSPEALDPAEIAQLSTEAISQLTIGEMLQVIQASAAPFLEHPPGEPPQDLQNASLEQLVYLARRHCRASVPSRDL